MRTRVLVVQPLFSVVLDESGQPCNENETVCTAACSEPASPAVGANGQILAKLAAMLQVAIANAPQLIAEISSLIALFGGKAPVASDVATV